MTTIRWKGIGVCIGIPVLVLGCSDPEWGDTTDRHDSPIVVCEPGETLPCQCFGIETEGVQVCVDEGTRWNDCQCGDGVNPEPDTDSDTDTDVTSGILICDGGKWDPITNLCWQDPPSDNFVNWSDAIIGCDNLVLGGHSDWRLPDIEELISLIRGCQDGTATGDVSRSFCTIVGCEEADNCDETSTCESCSLASDLEAEFCYWDTSLTGLCHWYWSSSPYADGTTFAWYVFFDDGAAHYHGPERTGLARCVRNGS
jgi:hypothetical protein